MDIELQTLIQQDIDMGIKNSFFYEIENQPQTGDIKYHLNNDLTKMKNIFQNQFDESQKVAD